jgi:hypothetical protein
MRRRDCFDRRTPAIERRVNTNARHLEVRMPHQVCDLLFAFSIVALTNTEDVAEFVDNHAPNLRSLAGRIEYFDDTRLAQVAARVNRGDEKPESVVTGLCRSSAAKDNTRGRLAGISKCSCFAGRKQMHSRYPPRLYLKYHGSFPAGVGQSCMLKAVHNRHYWRFQSVFYCGHSVTLSKK